MKFKKQQPGERLYQLAITTLFAIGGIFTSINSPAKGQLIPDNTLGAENSIITKDNDVRDIINGGATRGTNLFHSFEKFNVGENRSVYFANPTGIENILTRVTGGNRSEIFGTLGVNGFANLFLINPNGIFFGKDAVLDIRGSFTATTADEIKLGENGSFSATNPQSSNLLTVQPGALFRNAIKNQTSAIINEGNLQVDEGKNITFLGANVINTGGLKATGGEIQLTGTESLQLRGNLGTGTLLLDTKNLTIGEDNNAKINKTTLEGLSGNTNLIFQATNDFTINPLSNKSLSLASGSGEIKFTADVDSDGIGNFQMFITDSIIAKGRNLEIKGVNLTVGNINTSSQLGGGNINLNGISNITTEYLDSSSSSNSGNAGAGGTISLKTTQGNITTGNLDSYSFSFSGNTAAGGAISLKTSQGNITTKGYLDSSSSSFNGSVGAGGAISLQTSQGDITTTGNLNSYSFSFSGNAETGGEISLTTSQGDINTTGNLNSYSGSSLGNAGAGGAISLQTSQGDITIRNLDSYSFSNSGDAGAGGAISLQTSQGNITTTGYLDSSSFSPNGNTRAGGAISLQTSQGNITTTGNLDSSSLSPNGNAEAGGEITLSTIEGDITAKGNLNSYSSSNSRTAGAGGKIALSTLEGDITAKGNLNSYSRSNSGNTGAGGAISLQTSQGNITTEENIFSYSFSTSGNAGVGGKISISTLEGNIKTANLDSSSSSNSGKAGVGGDISLQTSQGNITTEDIFSSSSSTSGNSAMRESNVFTAQNNIKTEDIHNSSLFSLSVNEETGEVIFISTSEGDITEWKFLLSSINSIIKDVALGIYLTPLPFSPINIRTEPLFSNSLLNSGNAEAGGAISISTSQGNIKTGNLFSSSVSSLGNAGTGGAISLSTSQGDITTTGNILSSSSSNSGNAGAGGAISFSTSQGNIKTENLFSSSVSSLGNAGAGGSISLSTAQGNITIGNLNSFSSSDSENAEAGGAIALSTSEGNITTGNLFSASSSNLGNAGAGGKISLSTSQGDITTTGYLDSASSSNLGNAGAGGEISLSTSQGDITTTGYLNSSSFSNSGNAGGGGAISLSTSQGEISTTGNLNSYSSSPNGNAGAGGAISLETSQGNIKTENLFSASYSPNGNAQAGGAISLSTLEGDITTGYLISMSYSDLGNAGAGGDITIKIFNGDINIPFITSSASGQGGNSGKIEITGDNLDIYNTVIVSDGVNGSKSGIIRLDAPLIQFTNSDISSSSYSSGNSGEIQLKSTGDINVNNSRLFTTLEPGSTKAGGHIQIQTKNLNLSNFSVINTGTYSIGNAGNITVNAENVSLTNGSSLQSLTADQGNAGNIFLNVPSGNIFLTNSSSISTSATNTASGNSGNIEINSRTLSLLNGSQIQALTEGIGTSEAGEIIINVSDSILIGGIDPNFANPDPSALPGQNVIKVDYNNQQILGIGTNNSISTAQQIQASDFLINNLNKTNENLVFSSRVPYVSVKATGNDKIHVYAIQVNAGTQAVFDIDNTGFNSSGNFGTPEYKTFPAINTKLTLLDSQGNVLASNDNSPHGLGSAGSDFTMTLQQDPYIRYTFNQGGIYYIQVSNFNEQGVPSSYKNSEGKTITETFYDLQISLEPNPIQANINNQGQPSGIFAYTQGAGKAGNINLNTNTFNLENGGQISAFTNGSGSGGTVNLNAKNSVNLGVGVQNFAPVVSVETNGAGKAGDININTPNFTLSETARITATATENATNTEQGGSITLNASKMNLAGVVGILAETQGEAPAGTLKLNPYQNQNTLDLTLFPGSIISASTTAQGKGGDLIITAPQNINISGQGKLAVESTGSGDAGNIFITTQNLNITDGVKISASTSKTGRGGNINVNANKFNTNNGAQLLTTTSGIKQAGNINLEVRDNITLDGTNTGLFANTEIGSIGKSGNITIDPEIFIIKNGAGIGVNSQGSGEGGNISIEAGTLRLDNKGFINAETASNQGGNINLNIQDFLFLRNHSKITATAGTAQAGGDGGNININAPFIVAFPDENSDITANAFQGNGGKINITTNAIFGLEYRPKETEKSDITASSKFGLAGEVEINTPDVDPTSGLIELPENLVDAASLLGKDICSYEQRAKKNSFTIIGRGGIPAEANELISNSPGMLEWATRSNKPEVKRENLKSLSLEERGLEKDFSNSIIQEAQGWIITADGRVFLTAASPNITPQSSGLNHPGCGVLNN
ncbi:filamentous hemagglutinin N-terminal domain-containing protein [Anabaena sphaerica FACHB-251]|uniref:Filamentous hemagglutinin N-terminal domain-containing protein n=1 Tax=Anabaena sphaerica FACHB-251 TaxID=2692883 RepID=A0A926WN97_9NOST|nr:filamentous hemagglutinin N-terminal domain-containing protein [Anabaena sphaerica]MBD2296561.1 filamentous hemagglutinin N-terminal domain-containing protein [Anabaena sphaerica FACHB-251]